MSIAAAVGFMSLAAAVGVVKFGIDRLLRYCMLLAK